MIAFFKALFSRKSSRPPRKILVPLSSIENREDVSLSGKLHALPGTYDQSYFVNSKTGLFSFPKYSTSGSCVRIKDGTNYKGDNWVDFSKEERDEYTVVDFERDFYGADLEVDNFYSMFKRLTKEQLAPFGFLKSKGPELEELLHDIEEYREGHLSYLSLDSKLKTTMLKAGYFENIEFDNAADHDKYKANALNNMLVPQLKELSKAHNLKVGPKKADIITQLIEADIPLDLPAPIRPTERFDEMIRHLVGLYANNIRTAIDSWHPLLIKDIWEHVCLDFYLESHREPLDEVLHSKYWEERLGVMVDAD